MSPSKSLIKAITDAVITNTEGNVVLNERTFLSHLFDKNKRRFFFEENQEDRKAAKAERSFIITRWLLHAISNILVWILWGMHAIWYLVFSNNRLSRIKRILSFPWNWIKSTLKIKGIKNWWIQIKCAKRSQRRKYLNFRTLPAINLTMIIAALVGAVALIVNLLTFTIEDILFFPPSMSANEQGVITIEQPCMESHAFFLLNSSTLWCNTGISMGEGDKVTFSISGSAYSDVGDMYQSANDNVKPIYSRCRFDKDSDDGSYETGEKYCIYHKKDARFGSLLAMVAKEHSFQNGPETDDIVQIAIDKNKRIFKAKESGILFLSFNDILLTREMVSNILTSSEYESGNRLRRDLLDSKFFVPDTLIVDKDTLRDSSFLLRIMNNLSGKDSIYSIVDAFYKKNSPDSTIWFKDNIGEYLVNLRIERNIWKSHIKWYKKPLVWMFREFERRQRSDGFFNSNILLFSVIILLYLLIDILVSWRYRVYYRSKK